MRIVDRAAFLAMPAGTVYAKYAQYWFGELAIKAISRIGESAHDCGDWMYQDIAGSVDADSSEDMFDLLDRSHATGRSVPMDFDSLERDGMFDADQLFAVWEPADVQALIGRLQRALADAEAPGDVRTP